MTESEQISNVFTMPLLGGELLPVPISEVDAITRAVELTAGWFSDLSIVEILDPEEDSRAETAHWIALLVLEGSGVADKTIVEELDYETEADVRAECEVARVAVEEEKMVRVDFKIVNTQYHKFLRDVVQASVAPSKERQPALTKDQQELIQRYRLGEPGSESELEHTFLVPIVDFIDELGPDVPDETIDLAMRLLKEHALTVDVNSTVDFIDSLVTKIKDELEEARVLLEVAERTKNLDVPAYYDKLKAYGKSVGKRQIKSSLDTNCIDDFIEGANKYFDRRFISGTEEPIIEFVGIASRGKRQLAETIREEFTSSMTKNLKLSARMYEQKKADFHLAQLRTDKQEVFFSIALENIAKAKIEKFVKRLRQHKPGR